MPLIEYPDGELPTHLPPHPELDALMVLWHEVRSSGGLHIGRHDAMGDPPLDCSGVT